MDEEEGKGEIERTETMHPLLLWFCLDQYFQMTHHSKINLKINKNYKNANFIDHCVNIIWYHHSS